MSLLKQQQQRNSYPNWSQGVWASGVPLYMNRYHQLVNSYPHWYTTCYPLIHSTQTLEVTENANRSSILYLPVSWSFMMITPMTVGIPFCTLDGKPDTHFIPSAFKAFASAVRKWGNRMNKEHTHRVHCYVQSTKAYEYNNYNFGGGTVLLIWTCYFNNS